MGDGAESEGVIGRDKRAEEDAATEETCERWADGDSVRFCFDDGGYIWFQLEEGQGPSMDETFEQFWMVYIDGKTGPTKKHHDEAEALLEAERLIAAEPSRVVAVLKATHQLYAPKPFIVICKPTRYISPDHQAG